MNPVLMRAKALAFGTEEHTEARDLDFVLRCGELTALVGEQDSGRQTLFDGLNGNCAVQRGMILTPEGKIFPLQKKVFAAGSFFTEETSSRVQGVELTEMLFLMQPGGCKRLHWNTARRRKWAQELLDQVQLERDVREDVSRLSPMECFQLNLAAALDSGASLMTIQEDFEGFSVADFDQLVPILKKLQQTTGLAILLNTNSLRALEKLADEVFVFRNGTIAKKLRGEKIAPRTILDHLGGAQAASEAPRPQRETLFAIQGLRVRGCSCPIVLHRGEVLHVVDYDVREKQELYRILSGQQLAPGVSLQYEGHLLPQNWSGTLPYHGAGSVRGAGAVPPDVGGAEPDLSGLAAALRAVWTAGQRAGTGGFAGVGWEGPAEWKKYGTADPSAGHRPADGKLDPCPPEGADPAGALPAHGQRQPLGLAAGVCPVPGAGWSHSGDLFQPDILPWHFGTRRRCRAVGTIVRPDLGSSGGVPR